MKIIGLYEIEIMKDEKDTRRTLITEAKKEFNYSVQDREMNADRLQWKPANEFTSIENANNVIFNLITMIADSDNYRLDDDEFINMICEVAFLTREDYNEIVNK